MSAGEMVTATEALRVWSRYEGPGLPPGIFPALADVLDLATASGLAEHDQFQTLARLINEALR